MRWEELAIPSSLLDWRISRGLEPATGTNSSGSECAKGFEDWDDGPAPALAESCLRDLWPSRLKTERKRAQTLGFLGLIGPSGLGGIVGSMER